MGDVKMRVLFIAPQPFYQERGTPIAVKLALEALSARFAAKQIEFTVDLLTYAEGETVEIPGVRIIRIPAVKLLHGVGPGVSWKKLGCDVLLALRAFKLLWKNRREQYSVVHAVEESVFIAWITKKIFGTPYVYDMDSSLALQLTEKWWFTKPMFPLFRAMESGVIRGSIACAPVCDALEALANKNGSKRTVLLRDISLLRCSESVPTITRSELRRELDVEGLEPLALYVGNLEPYQGIDLLLESFAKVASHTASPRLAIIGGNPQSIQLYTRRAQELGIGKSVTFAGPRPIHRLGEYLECADILTSPRIRGNNTPMKIYSYLHSGKALLATDLPTHRQVLDESIAYMAPATVSGYADGLAQLIGSVELREGLGTRARERASRLYTLEAFTHQLEALYDHVEKVLTLAGSLPGVTQQVSGTSL